LGHLEFHVGEHGSGARRIQGKYRNGSYCQKKNTKYNGVRDIREISVRDI
jgi:hypothetical protein